MDLGRVIWRGRRCYWVFSSSTGKPDKLARSSLVSIIFIIFETSKIHRVGFPTHQGIGVIYNWPIVALDFRDIKSG